MLASGTGATFPTLTLADHFVAQRPYSMIAVDISATINNPNNTPMGFAVVVGTRQPEIAVSVNTKIIAQLIAGTGNIFNKSEWCGFGDYVVDIPSGCPVSLYTCGAVAGLPLVGVAVVHMIPEGE